MFVTGNIPQRINIPTGCGKTKIMLIWLLALANQVTQKQVLLPRRLVWIVNRRVVVDQATDEAEEIVKKILEEDELREIRDALFSLSIQRLENPIAVSTLRGELADNREWKKDPSRPAIIIGTVDMIGSKLLFSGYGDSAYWRPVHAGLLATDTLLVHDEAHLTPAFEHLLERILRLRGRPLRPFKIIQLTATQRSDAAPALDFASMLERDESIKCRIHAPKVLYLHPSDDLINAIVKFSLEHDGEGSRILVYVRRPKDAQKISKEISKKIRDSQERVAVLTGKIRGYERDKLVKERLFLDFKPVKDRPKLDHTKYLVCTSAGEVGIDLDADHCVCDLASIDSLIQRFGRVNRLGQGKAKIDLVYDPRIEQPKDGDPLSSSLSATLRYLQGLPTKDGGKDVSPITFARYLPPSNAFSPKPPLALLTPTLLDSWAMTSIDSWPGRMEVDLWLHGKEKRVHETYLVWRKDVSLLTSPSVEEDYLREVFKKYPIRAKERLNADTEDVEDFLADLSKEKPEMEIILIRRDGTIWRGSVSRVKDEGLEYGILVLPPEAGGLDAKGMLDSSAKDEVPDVADKCQKRMRLHVLRTDEGWKVEEIVSGESKFTFPWDSDWEKIAEDIEKKIGKILLKIDISRDELLEFLVYVGEPEEAEFQISKEDIELEEHERDVESVVKEIASKLEIQQLPELCRAARYHDEGKDYLPWQRAVGNPDPSRPLAKTKRWGFDKRKCPNYQHELGSFRKAVEKGEPPLVLHLILASHSEGRPLVKPEFGRIEVDVEKIAAEGTQNFINLQSAYGWWDLAYLEAILKSADILASEGVRGVRSDRGRCEF